MSAAASPSVFHFGVVFAIFWLRFNFQRSTHSSICSVTPFFNLSIGLLILHLTRAYGACKGVTHAAVFGYSIHPPVVVDTIVGMGGCGPWNLRDLCWILEEAKTLRKPGWTRTALS
jgi:hypothetical protein